MHVPFFELWQTHGKNTLLGLGARYIEGVTFNIFGVFIVGYLAGTLGLPRQTALAGVMISSAIMIVMLPIYGNLSDRIGRRRMFAVAGLLIGILSFPAFWLMETKEPLLVWIAIAVPFAFVYPAVYGPQAALFSELFDTRVRYTGISFVYQFSGIFASGLTPIIATALLPAGRRQALVDLSVCSGGQRGQCAIGLCDDRSTQARHGRRQQQVAGQTTAARPIMDLNLTGRVAVITGGAAGIGEAIGRALAAEGCDICVVDRDGSAAGKAAASFAPSPAPLPSTSEMRALCSKLSNNSPPITAAWTF